MQLITVEIEKPDDTNFFLGQRHFIKSVEDIHEALVAAMPDHRQRFFGPAGRTGRCKRSWPATRSTPRGFAPS
jgi:hypothetical protein